MATHVLIRHSLLQHWPHKHSNNFSIKTAPGFNSFLFSCYHFLMYFCQCVCHFSCLTSFSFSSASCPLCLLSCFNIVFVSFLSLTSQQHFCSLLSSRLTASWSHFIILFSEVNLSRPYHIQWERLSKPSLDLIEIGAESPSDHNLFSKMK